MIKQMHVSEAPQRPSATTQCSISYFQLWIMGRTHCPQHNKVNLFKFNLKHFTNCAQFKQKNSIRNVYDIILCWLFRNAAGNIGDALMPLPPHKQKGREREKEILDGMNASTPMANFNLLIHVFLYVLCAKFTFPKRFWFLCSYTCHHRHHHHFCLLKNQMANTEKLF